MVYRLAVSLNDGKRDPSPYDVECDHVDALDGRVAELLTNDYGQPFGVGVTLTIERVA